MNIQKLKLLIKHRKDLKLLINNYLKFSKNPEQSSWGSLTKEDLKGISYAVQQANRYSGPLIEIGTLFGHTTNYIACVKSPDKELVTIDNFCWNPFCLDKNSHRLFTKRTLQYAIQHGKTTLFEGTFDEYTQTHHLQPSMVFIDAAHSYAAVKADILNAQKLNCPIICGHDYQPLYQDDVMKAVDECYPENKKVFGSVWVAEHHDNALTV